MTTSLVCRLILLVGLSVCHNFLIGLVVTLVSVRTVLMFKHSIHEIVNNWDDDIFDNLDASIVYCDERSVKGAASKVVHQQILRIHNLDDDIDADYLCN